MYADDFELIERSAEQIAGKCWTERKVPRDWPLAAQLVEFVRNADSRGPGVIEGPELQRLFDLAGDAEQLEKMGPAVMEF